MESDHKPNVWGKLFSSRATPHSDGMGVGHSCAHFQFGSSQRWANERPRNKYCGPIGQDISRPKQRTAVLLGGEQVWVVVARVALLARAAPAVGVAALPGRRAFGVLVLQHRRQLVSLQEDNETSVYIHANAENTENFPALKVSAVLRLLLHDYFTSCDKVR